MTKACAYCGAENFGEGVVKCRGCGNLVPMGAGRACSETMAIAEAVNHQAAGQIVFGGAKDDDGAQLLLFPRGLRCGSGNVFFRRAV